MVIFQIIPIMTLVMYFLYVTYYYAAPMFWLKILLFFGHIRYRGADIRFSEGKITMKIPKDGEEIVVERPLDVDFTSRFLAMNVCAEFRGMLRDIRKGNFAKEEQGEALQPGAERPDAAKTEGQSAD